MNEQEPKPAAPRAGHSGHAGHGWMMMICCIPMIVIVIALVATGVATSGFLFSAVACVVMMAMMMRMMSAGKRARDDGLQWAYERGSMGVLDPWDRDPRRVGCRPARLQRAPDATIYSPLAGGCHCAHDTRTAILDGLHDSP